MSAAAAVPTATDTRRVLKLTTVGFVALHVFHARVQGGGGWNKRHGGLLGAIWQFFRLSAKDPVLSAGLSDFAVVSTVLGAVLVVDLPPAARRSWRVKAWLGLYTLFPGLGALLYFLWLAPDHRFVAGGAA